MTAVVVVGVLALTPTQYGVASISTGSGAPPAGMCSTLRVGHLYVDISIGRLHSCDATGAWKGSATAADVAAVVSSGMPSGAIVFVTSGSCPPGTSEATELNGRVALGTLAANANVGTTGGADTITPAVADHASHTHTYTQIVNHTHPLATGTTATGNFSQVVGAIDASSGGTGGTATQAAVATVSGNPAGGVASGTTAGPSATLAHVGTQFDNRSAFVRVIACRAS